MRRKRRHVKLSDRSHNSMTARVMSHTGAPFLRAKKKKKARATLFRCTRRNFRVSHGSVACVCRVTGYCCFRIRSVLLTPKSRGIFVDYSRYEIRRSLVKSVVLTCNKNKKKQWLIFCGKNVISQWFFSKSSAVFQYRQIEKGVAALQNQKKIKRSNRGGGGGPFKA